MSAVLIWLCAATATAAHPPVLANELGLISPGLGSRVEIIARYQSLLGSVLRIEDCEAEFEIDASRDYPALRDPELRNIELLVRGVLLETRVGDPPRYRVEDVRRAPPPLELFRQLIGSRPSTPAWHSKLLAWALEVAQKRKLPKLEQAAIEHLVDCLEKLLAQPANGEVALGSLALLESSHPFAGDKTEWKTWVLRIAERYGERAEIVPRLEALGYMRGNNGWRQEADLLQESGLARVGGRITSQRLVQLQSQLANWVDRRTAPVLLRGQTDAQYRQHARNKVPKPGMNRGDLLSGWGYPEQVSWIRKDNFFESWTTHAADGVQTFYLVEGLVFAWD